jgi:aerobic-type carbon monoxide dehydrogenase small subunit (CoxS/CutS family)
MAEYTIHVNGRTHNVNVDPDTPLLWVLRDELRLVGAKYGCGIAQCGACTIHMNGVPMISCVLPISTIGISRITTIEGLSENGDNPVQKAWKELDVPQCGFCQTGQMMTAAYILNDNPDPSDKEIEQAMSGNLCRCATYNRIKEAVKRAAVLSQ